MEPLTEKEREDLIAKGGHKDDTGKLPWELLPFDAITEIVKVLLFGKNKYRARNWETGMDYSRPFSALMRHATAWWMGEDKDPETGLSHLAHCGCCLFFLLAYECRGMKQFDNRPNSPRGLAETNVKTEDTFIESFPKPKRNDSSNGTTVKPEFPANIKY